METNLIIHSVNASTGEKVQQTVTDINPKASNADIKNFAQQLNSLTMNQYAETERIDKTVVDTSAQRDIRLTSGTISRGASNVIFSIDNAEEETVKLAVIAIPISGSAAVLSPTATSSGNPATITLNIPSYACTFCIITTETDEYPAESFIATVE